MNMNDNDDIDIDNNNNTVDDYFGPQVSLDQAKQLLSIYNDHIQSGMAHANLQSFYVKFRIQTMQDFEDEMMYLPINEYWSPMILQSDAERLQSKWGRGCYLFLYNCKHGIHEFLEYYCQCDTDFMYMMDVKDDVLDLNIVWLPLSAAKIFFMGFGLKLVEDTHFERYLHELGFYVFLVYGRDNGKQNVIRFTTRYVIGPSFKLDESLKHYFEQKTFKYKEFKNLIGKRLLKKMLNYECRAILLQKLMENYFEQNTNPDSKEIGKYSIIEMTRNKQLLSEYVFNAFMHTFNNYYNVYAQKKGNANIFLVIKLYRINKYEFYKFANEHSNQFTMINIQYIFICWMKHNLKRMNQIIVGEWIIYFNEMLKDRHFKQARLYVLEQKLTIAMCKLCGRKSCKRNKLKLCNKCQTTFYCNRKCQKRDWKSHRRYCCSVSDY